MVPEQNGVLIYLINKQTGRKFGCHSEKNEPGRVHIYNEVDQSIDSFHIGLPYEKLVILMDLMNIEKYGVNSDLFSDEEKSNYELKLVPMEEELLPMNHIEETMAVNEELPRFNRRIIPMPARERIEMLVEIMEEKEAEYSAQEKIMDMISDILPGLEQQEQQG